MTDSKNLNILLVSVSLDDARNALAKLEQYGYQVEHQIVTSQSAMRTALVDDNWDIVLCNYDPPGFSGPDALQLARSENIDVPFLFMLHDLREEAIIHAMKSDVDDYIFTDRLVRLVPTIELSLHKAHIRREHHQTQIALQENQSRLNALIVNLPGMACHLVLKPDGGMSFDYVSEGSQALLCLNPKDMERDYSLFRNRLHPDDRTRYEQSMHTSAKNLSLWNWEGRIVLPQDGEIKWINLRCSPRRLADGGVQWDGIMSNISHSKLVEIENNRAQQQLRELSLHIQDVREQERLNIAREVHDNLGSTLTALKLDIAWLNERLATAGSDLSTKTRDIEEMADSCINATNNIMRVLRPSVLDCFGIIAAIETEAQEFEQRTGIACIIEQSDETEQADMDTSIGPEVSIALFRILQEALANITRHAQASRVKISIYNRIDCVSLIISDNGRGFTASDLLKPRAFGLRSIRERVAHLGGDVQIDSVHGEGVTIGLCVPTTPEHIAAQAEPAQQILF